MKARQTFWIMSQGFNSRKRKGVNCLRSWRAACTQLSMRWHREFSEEERVCSTGVKSNPHSLKRWLSATPSAWLVISINCFRRSLTSLSVCWTTEHAVTRVSHAEGFVPLRDRTPHRLYAPAMHHTGPVFHFCCNPITKPTRFSVSQRETCSVNKITCLGLTKHDRLCSTSCQK